MWSLGSAGPWRTLLEAFLVSTGVVALGEMGDKTQLLSIVLAAAFREHIPVIAGILLPTLVNHAAGGSVGGWVAQALGPDILRWVIPGHGRLDADPRRDSGADCMARRRYLASLRAIGSKPVRYGHSWACGSFRAR